jgi:thiamine biosynthesis lipoprotein
VGLRHPLRPGRRLATITLRDQALGTSGSGTQFFIDRGRRLGHILDPRSGLPADGVLSATVIAPAAADADALATALYVLGPDGVDRVAPPGGPVAAILVLPAAAPGTIHMVLANLDDATVGIEAEAGMEISRRPAAE